MMPPRRPSGATATPGRRKHVALVPPLPRLDGEETHEGVLAPENGAAGSPTPTERQAVYLAELRRGGPPPGWGAARAREWGLNPATVARELTAARAVLDESRSPDAVQVLAHELTVQAGELADEIEELAHRPVEADRDTPAEIIEARGRAMGEQAKALGLAASLKLKTAATLLAVHKAPLPGAGQRRHIPDPSRFHQSFGEALRSGTSSYTPGLHNLKGG